jgi:hypothetical protein
LAPNYYPALKTPILLKPQFVKWFYLFWAFSISFKYDFDSRWFSKPNKIIYSCFWVSVQNQLDINFSRYIKKLTSKIYFQSEASFVL